MDRTALLVLDLGLQVGDGVIWRDIQCDGLVRDRLREDLELLLAGAVVHLLAGAADVELLGHLFRVLVLSRIYFIYSLLSLLLLFLFL